MDPSDTLAGRGNPDGGFGPVRGSASEPEATAMAAISLGDAPTAAWLEHVQADDGSVGMRAGSVFRDVTAIALLAMREPSSQGAALAWVMRARANAEPSTEALPHDPTLRGWSWTSDSFGWAEPTAWAVLALRAFAEEGPELDDGVAVLRDRECVGGGWNYGNRIVLDEELPPFVQTTGLALLALHGLDEPMVGRGIERLGSLWRDERDGVLSLAVATAALRRYGHADLGEATRSLRGALDATIDIDTMTLSWAAIALGDGLERMGVA